MSLSVNDLSQSSAKTGLGISQREKLVANTSGLMRSDQTVAATATESLTVLQPGILRGLGFSSFNPAAVGEDITVDVQVNGVSALTAPYKFDDTQAVKVVHALPMIAIPIIVQVGDRVDFIRTYTAGAGPTPIASNVIFGNIFPTA
jgi:hypothetical protein